MDDQHTDRYSMPKPVDIVPKRVVSLVPSITESLFDLDLGSCLIGVTDYCIYPADGVAILPKVGGTKNPDIDKIIKLKPDLVMMNDEENRKEDAKALQAAGIRIWVTGPRTIPEAFNLLWEMMDVFDEPSMVPRVRHIERVYDIVSQAGKSLPPLRTFVPIWHDPWMTINQDTYIHDLLATLALENVFADRVRQYPLKADLGEADPIPEDDPRVADRDVRYPRVTLEEIEEMQPELILLPSEPFEFEAAHAEILYNLDIPAAHYGTIYLIDGSLLSWHGTRIAYALTEMPPILDEARERLSNDG
jgi:ABC-type Fe3+-hydroxamate transport system substrate-binding protein